MPVSTERGRYFGFEMKSYKIQHDFLYGVSSLEKEKPNTCKEAKKVDFKKAIPVRLSIVLSPNGEEMMKAYALERKPILLLDDIPAPENEILSDYKECLIRGVMNWFSNRKILVFLYE